MRTSITRGLALAVGLGALIAAPAQADPGHQGLLRPGNLLVSTSVYSPADITQGVTQLPPGCTTNCMLASAPSDYPFVFNNDSADPNFGITSKAFLDELTPWGWPVARIPVPDDQLVTSFSSKSELALNLSPEGKYVSFVGYDAAPATIDVSNANTPGVIDPGNPVTGVYYRVIAQLDGDGNFTFTRTNAFSGDNGRAAITNDENGADLIYAAGNAGQSKVPPAGVILGTGAQFITPSSLPEADQLPGLPTPLGSFNITQLGLPHDKFSKDTNFRGITISNNVVYYTKGSGGNGINTVYFVDTTGKACPNGVGLPEPGAPLPTAPLSYDPAVLTTQGVKPNNMCILKGFPTNLATSTTMFPFGMWFANADTLYLADEGSGDNTYSSATGQYTNATAAAQPAAGLEKWVFDSSTGQWNLAYTLQNGLNLGQPYTIPGYPTGINAGTGLPWSPATDGLRGLTGHVSRDGVATIWAVTSTVSGGGDQGADPDKLVAISDPLDATTPAPWERFFTLRTARFGEILRGVSFTPGTESNSH